jgi:rhodanese-related sulfurtransferase
MNRARYVFLVAGLVAAGVGARQVLRPSAAQVLADSTEPTSGVQVVGPSAALRMQRAGAVIFDARTRGRTIPGAQRGLPRNITAPPLVAAGSGEQAQRWASARGWRGVVRWLPSHLLEVRDYAGVAQIDPRAAWRQVGRGEIEIIDVSEADEWDAVRLPGSRRVSWAQIAGGDRSWVPRDKQIVFT